MAVVTASEVVLWTDISASAATITNSGLIDIVQDRIGILTGNYFTAYGIDLTSSMTFNATARTIVATANWADNGFAAGDEIFIYGSYRNDGYYECASVTTVTMTLAAGETVVDELSGASVLVSLVRWPRDVRYAAAYMVKFDYDDRGSRQAGAISRSLGPYSESFGDGGGMSFGYPAPVLELLRPYRQVSLV